MESYFLAKWAVTMELPRNNLYISEFQNHVRPEPVEGREPRPHVLCLSPFDKLRMNGDRVQNVEIISGQFPMQGTT